MADENPVGRPCTVTDEVIAKLADGFMKDFNVKEACLYAGITTFAYYRYAEQHEDFAIRMDMLRHNLKMHAKANIAAKIFTGDEGKGDTDLSQWLLERRAKEEYATRTEQVDVPPLPPAEASKTPEEAARGYQDVMQHVKPKS